MRVHGKEKNLLTAASNYLHKELYEDYSPEEPKSEYKIKTLFNKLRAWHKIILGCINPRPSTNSSDYINTHQKYMLHCLVKHKKLCLPFIIFQYLREIIIKSRTTAGDNKKIIRYIPFGRLLSNILVESGLVDDPKDAQCTEDLKASTGEVLDAKNMKKMGVVTSVIIPPEPESSHDALMKRFFVDGYPLFYKIEPPEVIAQYIYDMQQDVVDTSSFNFDDLPYAPDDVHFEKKRKKRSTEGDEKKKKKAKKDKKSKEDQNSKIFGLQSHSEASSRGNSEQTSSGIPVSIHIDTILCPSSQPSQQTQPPLSHTSTQIPTPIPSATIQTETIPIISTTSEQAPQIGR